MRYIYCFYIFIALFGSASLFADEKSSMAEEWQQFLKQLDKKTENRIHQTDEFIDAKLKATDELISQYQAQLNHQTEQLSSKLKKEKRMTIQELKQRREDLLQWSERVEDNAEYTWNEMSKGLSRAFNNIDNAIERIERRLDSR